MQRHVDYVMLDFRFSQGWRFVPLFSDLYHDMLQVFTDVTEGHTGIIEVTNHKLFVAG